MIFYEFNIHWLEESKKSLSFDLFLYDESRKTRFYALERGDEFTEQIKLELERYIIKGAIIQIEHKDIHKFKIELEEFFPEFELLNHKKMILAENYINREKKKEALGHFNFSKELENVIEQKNSSVLIARCLEEILLFSFEQSQYQSSLIKIVEKSLQKKGVLQLGAAFTYFFSKRFGVKDELFLLELIVLFILKDIGLTQIPFEKRFESDQNDKEYSKHTMYSYYVLKKTEREFSERFVKILVDHHERIDGRGFPREKKGKHIHIGAQIIGIVDELFYDWSFSSEDFYKRVKKLSMDSSTGFSSELKTILASLQP